MPKVTVLRHEKTVNQDLVKTLNELLEKARAGEISSAFIVSGGEYFDFDYALSEFNPCEWEVMTRRYTESFIDMLRDEGVEYAP